MHQLASNTSLFKDLAPTMYALKRDVPIFALAKRRLA
jgi:hypothetical protein